MTSIMSLFCHHCREYTYHQHIMKGLWRCLVCGAKRKE